MLVTTITPDVINKFVDASCAEKNCGPGKFTTFSPTLSSGTFHTRFIRKTRYSTSASNHLTRARARIHKTYHCVKT